DSEDIEMDSSMEPRPSSAAEKSQGKKKESLVCPGTSNTLGPCIGAMHKQLCDIATVHACIPIVYALCSIVYYAAIDTNNEQTTPTMFNNNTQHGLTLIRSKCQNRCKRYGDD
ncbi:hypothetical protein PV328_012125, partial [Microctonus aethiopoides]